MIAADKILHIETSALLVIVLSILFPLWLSTLLVVCIGIGKEIYDKHHNGCSDIKDIYADIIGIALGILITFLI